MRILTWLFEGAEFDSSKIEDNVGFVYLIVHLESGRKYIGKKNFFSKKTLKPLKGKTRKRITRKESDWKTYFGSNKDLIEMSKNNEKSFSRNILRLCKTKGEMSYFETKFQFENDVLLKEEYFNDFIGCKIHSSHLKHLLQKKQ